MQRTNTEHQPTNFHPSTPSMGRPPSNALTFNVAVMFLFYVLSVSLCLSSFSTCICVIFDPVGTFCTIANYLFYALGSSILLAFLFIALTGVCFDSQNSPESQRIQEIVDETLLSKGKHEVSALNETVHSIPTQEVHRRYAMVVEAEREWPRPLKDADAFIVESAARDDRVPHSTPAASASQQTLVEDGSQELLAGGNLRFREEISASPEQMSNVFEDKANAPGLKSAGHIKTASQDKAFGDAITARESKKIEKWISHTNSANPRLAQAFSGMLKGDDTDDEDLSKRMAGIMVWRSDDGDPTSGTRHMSQESDFQKALRVYMSMGPKVGRRQRKSGIQARAWFIPKKVGGNGWKVEEST